MERRATTGLAVGFDEGQSGVAQSAAEGGTPSYTIYIEIFCAPSA